MNDDCFLDKLRECINQTPEIAIGFCDWIEAKHFRLGGPASEIRGTVGFLTGKDVLETPIAIHLGSQPASRDEVDWASLVPRKDMQCEFYFDNDVMHIDLTAT
ncbi:MAG: hypothetical protein AAGJ46_09865 [Planctomycetota bacterium]